MESYSDSVERFLKAADWLDDTDAPAIAALRHLAAELDNGDGTSAMVNVFTVTHRSLLKKREKGQEGDEDEAFLDSLL